MSGVLEPFIFLLELVFFEHKPRRWVRRVFRVFGSLYQPGALLMRRAPEAEIATAAAAQSVEAALPAMPRFVKNAQHRHHRRRMRRLRRREALGLAAAEAP
jgi:hypothetical protein